MTEQLAGVKLYIAKIKKTEGSFVGSALQDYFVFASSEENARILASDWAGQIRAIVANIRPAVIADERDLTLEERKVLKLKPAKLPTDGKDESPDPKADSKAKK